MIGKRRIVKGQGNVLMNKRIRVVQFTGTEIFQSPKSYPYPFSFASNYARVCLQRVYLVLQGNVLVHQALDLPGKACVFVCFFLGDRKRPIVNRNAQHYKDRCDDEERYPPRSRCAARHGCFGSAASYSGRAFGCWPIFARTIPINISGLVQAVPPDRPYSRSRRIS